MSNRSMFVTLQSRANERWFKGKLRVVRKNQIELFRIINRILNVVYDKQDRFIKGFWTTLCYGFILPRVVVAAPQVDKPLVLDQWWTLAHECGHGLQAKRWTPYVFAYFYMWPLTQGVLLMLSCWVPVFWASGWSLVGWIVGWFLFGALHFIPKLPDPWRTHWEFECYCISMYYRKVRYGKIDNEYVERLVGLFTDMSYYQMASSEKRMSKKLFAARNEIERGTHAVAKHPVVVLVDEIRKDLTDGST